MAYDAVWGPPPTYLYRQPWRKDSRPGSAGDIYGTPLPIVYGTSKVLAKPVFMTNSATAIAKKWESAPGGADGSVPGWSSTATYAVGDWVRHGGYFICLTPSTGYTDARDPHDYPHYWLPASQVEAEAGRWAIAAFKDERYYFCQAGSTASSFAVTGADLGGSATSWKTTPYSVARVITFYSGPNAGLSRLATPTSVYPTYQVSTPFPYTPNTGTPGGDVFGISRPVPVPAASVILGVCEAPVTSITKVFQSGAPAQTDFTYVNGVFGSASTVLDAASSTWSLMDAYKDTAGTQVAQGMKLAGTVQVRLSQLILEDQKVPEVTVEVKGIGASASVDAHPADVLLDLLNRLPTPLAAYAVVDTGPDGLAASSYRTYCTAMGFAVSRTVDESTPATQLLEELLYQTGATLVWSDGLLKVVPLGDKAVGSYAPPSSSTAITTDDIMPGKGEDPIVCERTPEEDVVNTITVEYASRAIDYEPRTVEYSDAAHVTQYGVRRGPSVQARWIATEAHAMALASIIVGRSVRIRNTYRFRLPPRFALLEPMDFVTLTDANAGLSAVQARIKEIEERDDGTLQVVAYEWPVGATNVVAQTVQGYDGYVQATAQSSAGDIALMASVVAAEAAQPDLANVVDGSVTETKLADAAVTGTKLAADAISTTDYAEDGDTYPTFGARMVANTTYPAWATNTAYTTSDIVTNGGRIFKCVIAGTSAGTSVGAWSAGTTYAAGAYCYYSGATYCSRVVGNTNHTPSRNDVTYWEWRGANTGPAGDDYTYFKDGSTMWEPYAQLRISPVGAQVGKRAAGNILAASTMVKMECYSGAVNAWSGQNIATITQVAKGGTDLPTNCIRVLCNSPVHWGFPMLTQYGVTLDPGGNGQRGARPVFLGFYKPAGDLFPMGFDIGFLDSAGAWVNSPTSISWTIVAGLMDMT